MLGYIIVVVHAGAVLGAILTLRAKPTGDSTLAAGMFLFLYGISAATLASGEAGRFAGEGAKYLSDLSLLVAGVGGSLLAASALMAFEWGVSPRPEDSERSDRQANPEDLAYAALVQAEAAITEAKASLDSVRAERLAMLDASTPAP